MLYQESMYVTGSVRHTRYYKNFWWPDIPSAHGCELVNCMPVILVFWTFLKCLLSSSQKAVQHCSGLIDPYVQ